MPRQCKENLRKYQSLHKKNACLINLFYNIFDHSSLSNTKPIFIFICWGITLVAITLYPQRLGLFLRDGYLGERMEQCPDCTLHWNGWEMIQSPGPGSNSVIQSKWRRTKQLQRFLCIYKYFYNHHCTNGTHVTNFFQSQYFPDLLFNFFKVVIFLSSHFCECQM